MGVAKMVSTPLIVVTNSLMMMVIPPDVVVAFPSGGTVVRDMSVIMSGWIEAEEVVDVSDAVDDGLVVVLESDVEHES